MRFLTNLVLSLTSLAIISSCSPQQIFVKKGSYNEISLEEARKKQYVEVNIMPTNPETGLFFVEIDFNGTSKYRKEYSNQLKMWKEVRDSLESAYPNTDTGVLNERYRGRETIGILAGMLKLNNVAFHNN